MLKSIFPRLSLRERLLLYSHVDEMGCWLWQGTQFKNTGYGQITYRKKVYSAHRLSLHVFKNFDLTLKDLVLHRCDVKRCVNPAHLYIGDRFDNARDMVKRGQQIRGSSHHQAKLNEAQVKEIKKLLRQGLRYGAIAQRFGVDASAIGHIKRGNTWTHVKETK